MIPKIIHYCWFGGNPLPNYAVKYIKSWEKYFPDYEIKEWNESNYNVHKIPYTSQAYNAKKYAFVSDYARFDILYDYGGIYFDVDVEVIKPFGKILDDTGFIGTESLGTINAGLGIGCNAGLGVGCNAGLKVLKEILEHYAEDRFLCKNGLYEYNLKTVVSRVTEILVKKGFDAKSYDIQKIAGFTIYPPEYFAPENPATYLAKITDNSVSIHHFWIGEEKDAISWSSDEVLRTKYFRKRFFGLFGDTLFSLFVFKVCCIFRKITRFFRMFFNKGLVGTITFYHNKIKEKIMR